MEDRGPEETVFQPTTALIAPLPENPDAQTPQVAERYRSAENQLPQSPSPESLAGPASPVNPPIDDLRALLDGENGAIVAFCLAYLA